MSTLIAVVFDQYADFASQRAFGSVWRHFYLSQLAMRWSATGIERVEARKLLNIWCCTGHSPTTENIECTVNYCKTLL